MRSHLTEDERNYQGDQMEYSTVSTVFSVQRFDTIEYGGNVLLAQSVWHPH